MRRIVILCALVLASCGTTIPMPSRTPAPSPTLEPTATPVTPTATVGPTVVPVPSNTPEPTGIPTIKPTATLVPALLDLSSVAASGSSRLGRRGSVQDVVTYLQKWAADYGMNYTVTVAHDGFVPGTRLRYAAIVVDNYDRNTRRVNGRTLAETLKNPDLGKAVDNARFVEIVGKHYKVKGIFNPYAQAYVIIDVRVTSGGIKDDQIADDLGFEFANPAGRCPLEGSCRSMYSNGIDTILAVLDGQDMGWTDSVTKDVKAYKRFNIPSAFLSVRGFVIRDAEFRSVVSADEYAFVLEQIK